MPTAAFNGNKKRAQEKSPPPPQEKPLKNSMSQPQSPVFVGRLHTLCGYAKWKCVHVGIPESSSGDPASRPQGFADSVREKRGETVASSGVPSAGVG